MPGSKHITVLLLFLTAFACGQNIRGKIIDTQKNPASYSTISVLNAHDSSLVKGTIADEEGSFSIQHLLAGNYLLKVTAIGFNTNYSDLQVDTASFIDVPLIVLNSEGIQLNEVSVGGIKRAIEFKNGNIIVNVENSPLAKGNTAYELLSKLPGVTIDNNVIQLNGKPGVMILMDGRVQQLSDIQLLNMLKSMNAELIQRIELLKNPPTKYDAAGTSGMIQIITKKTKLRGISGSLYTSSSQGTYGRSMSGMGLNFKSDKFVVFSNLDYNLGYYYNEETFNKKFHSDSTVTEFDAFNKVKDLDNSLSYRIGADWLANKKNTIGFKIDGGPGSYNSESNGTNSVLQYNDLGFDHLNAIVSTPDVWNIGNYNINAEHRFDTSGTVLNFTSDYTKLRETYAGHIQNIFLDANNNEALPPIIYQNSNVANSSIIASKLDFTKVIDSLSSFEVGVKAGFINTENRYLFERKNNITGIYNVDTALTNNYAYSERTYAAYFNYIRTFRKISMQLGLRAEYTALIGQNKERGFELRRNFYNVFPNISMEYEASKNHVLQLNVNRRIDRPDYNNLNPFRSFRDQYTYFEGNPFLLPHYSNTAEISHSYKEFMTNTFSYTHIDQVMLQYTAQNDSDKVTRETIKNMKYHNYYSYSFYLQHTLKPWWEISASGIVSYIEYRGDVEAVPFRTASFYYTPTLTSTFIAFSGTKIELMAFFNSAKNNGLVQVKPRWMISLALKKTFFKDKLDCSIGINDIFYSAFYRTSVNFDNQDWNFRVTQDSRRLVISLNYNFGKVSISERNVDSSEEEKDRLSH